MTEYTPTTDEVRAAYVRAMRQAFVAASSEHEAEFERWLVQVKDDALDRVSPSTEFRVAKEAIEEKVKLQVEVMSLKRSLDEALHDLSEWDEVWYALYRPGTLGSSKAKQTLEEIHRMNRLIEQLIHEIENPPED